jgi:hypothetical protein
MNKYFKRSFFMYYCPYADYSASLYRQTLNDSYIRVFHASPNAPSVDVYLNDNPVISGLPYRGFSQYLRRTPGRYNVKVFPSGRRDTPVIDTILDIPARSIITLSAVGLLPNISLLPILEPTFDRIPGRTYLRVAQLSPNLPNLDLVTGGNKLFSNVGFKDVTDYAAIDPGTYTFEVNLTENGQRVLYVPNITLLPDRIYTIYPIGLANASPPLQVVIPLDGSTYIKI